MSSRPPDCPPPLVERVADMSLSSSDPHPRVTRGRRTTETTEARSKPGWLDALEELRLLGFELSVGQHAGVPKLPELAHLFQRITH